MASERAKRLALNEALFREANERMAAWEERHSEQDAELYHCECVDLECREKVPVSQIDYEHVRQRSDCFLIAPGHEASDVESVVETGDHWSIVRKDPEVRELVEETDPRS